jgi:hypothetical protein
MFPKMDEVFLHISKNNFVAFLSRAFNEVKATSRAHDKQVSLNTNKNYNVLQASKPWASSDELAALARGRGASRGRGFPGRGGGRAGNDWGPRNDKFNAGGTDQFTPPKSFNSGRGHFNHGQKPARGNPQANQQRNPQQNSNNNAGFSQKPRPQNKNFRNGGKSILQSSLL